MNSASGTLRPLFSGCPGLSLFPSSLSSHQGHPRPAHRGPCAPLSHPLAHIFPRSRIPVPSVRCIPDVLCASHHLFSTSSSFPCWELWVASIPPGTITSLSLHYGARPPCVLQCHCWHPLLPPCIYHSSFPSVTGSKSPGTSIFHAFILSPSESVHALHAFFHPLRSCFQPVHHRAFVNISVFLFCFASVLSFCLGRRSLKVLTFYISCVDVRR